MSDLINRQAAIDAENETIAQYIPYLTRETNGIPLEVALTLKRLPSAQPEQKWILVESRPMDNEERLEWSEKLGYDIEYNEAFIYTSQLPDDGQKVLVCGRYGRIWIDKFENDPDYGCSFEENGDMDGIVAWMPLPEPPKEG